jgi:hypothetical protein
MSGVVLLARRRTGLITHEYMSCVDNRTRVGGFNFKLASNVCNASLCLAPVQGNR